MTEAELKALSDAATPGHWRASSASMGGFSPIMGPGGVIVALVSTLAGNSHDPTFITALVNAYRAGAIGDTAAADKAGYERGLREAAGSAASFTVWPGKTVRQQVANATAQAAEAAILSKLEKTDD